MSTTASTIVNFGIVSEGRLYRGAQPTADQFGELRALGVNVSIDLREPWGRQAEAEACIHASIRHFNIPIGFGPLSFGIEPPTRDEIAHIFSLIQDPANICFVHCAHGEDRTSAVIAAYRIAVEGWTNEQALEEAKSFHLNPLQIGIREWIENYRAPSSKV